MPPAGALSGVLFGTLALFAAMRAVWFSSQTRAASLLTGLFVATNFLLLVHARIAMLDVFMVGFVMVALWMFAAAVRETETGTLAAGRCAGAALGARDGEQVERDSRGDAAGPGLPRCAGDERAAAVPDAGARLRRWRGFRCGKRALWLGLLPLAVYALTFWPFLFWTVPSGDPTGLIDLHRQMLALQTQVPEPHPYQSVWWQWVGNSRAIWYLYEPIDGAQRGVMLIGNPVTMLVRPARARLVRLGRAGSEKRRDLLALVLLYAVSHGAVGRSRPSRCSSISTICCPRMFLSGALALAVERLWQRGERLVPWAMVLGALAFFVFFYPILTAAPLDGEQGFLTWAWTAGWR